jgi:preprotein translocase subunit SecF
LMKQLLVGTKFDFMGKRKYAAIGSGLAILISIVSLVAHGGPRLSIDFTGGTLVQILFDKDVSLGDIRDALSRESQASTGPTERCSSGCRPSPQRIRSPC